jgi:hypothetical protein
MNSIIIIIFLLVAITFFAICNTNNSKLINIYLTVITLTSYILSFRNINILGLNINASTIVYSSILPLILLYLENNKYKDTKELIAKNNLVLIITIFLLMLTVGYIPSIKDTNAINIQNTIGNNFRILIAYPLAITISEYLLIFLYNKLKKIYPTNLITIIISISLTISIDIIMYNLIVYLFKINIIEILYIMAVTYVVRLIISLVYILIINNLITQKKVKK